MIIIGKSLIKDKITKKNRPWKYSDIKEKENWIENNDWVETSHYLPIPFDLMELKVKDRPKPLPGWHDGQKWQGLRIKKDYKVIQWKRVIYYD